MSLFYCNLGQQTSAQVEQPPAAEKGIIVVSLIYIIEVHVMFINIIITLSNYLEQRLLIKCNTLLTVVTLLLIILVVIYL